MLPSHRLGPPRAAHTVPSDTPLSAAFVDFPTFGRTSFTNGKPAASTVRKILNKVNDALFAFSDWLMGWTPCCLVISYFIVCPAIFVMCSTQAITVFYYFYMVANLYIAVVALIESFLGISPVREAQASAEKAQQSNFPTISEDALPTMNMVMVAYLPNEKDIIVGQIMYALEELVYPKDKLRISEPTRSQLTRTDLMTVVSSRLQHT